MSSQIPQEVLEGIFPLGQDNETIYKILEQFLNSKDMLLKTELKKTEIIDIAVAIYADKDMLDEWGFNMDMKTLILPFIKGMASHKRKGRTEILDAIKARFARMGLKNRMMGGY